MKKADDLKLYECALLLALRDEEGTIPAGSMEHFALGGGLLAELLLRGQVASENEGKKDRIAVKIAKSTGDALLDECLGLVRKSKKARSASHWVSKFSGIRKLKHRVAEGLCGRGILRAAEDRVLGIFSRKVYPEVEGGPEDEVVGKIRTAILTETSAIDPRTVVLIALSRHSNLLRNVLTKREIKARKARIEKIVQGEIVDKAVKKAIEAMRAAIVCAALIPAICAA